MTLVLALQLLLVVSTGYLTVGAIARRRSAPASAVLWPVIFAINVVAAWAAAPPFPSWGPIAVAGAVAVALIAGVLTLPKRPGVGRDADGIDAIIAACDVIDRQERRIADFDRSRAGMSMGARLADSFIVTRDEEERDAAMADAALWTEMLERTVPTVSLRHARTLLDADPAAAALANSAAIDHEPFARRVAAADRLVVLANEAVEALESAESSLSSAKSMETLDAVSSNKAISIMSSSSTSSARSAVDDARDAVRALAEATEELSGDLRTVDDGFDLVLDMALDMPFDFVSFMNISKLSAAEDDCERVRAVVEERRTHLESALTAAISSAAPTLAAWRVATNPFMEAARRDVPERARHLVPESMPLPETPADA
jgi:hypothetical protein